MPRSSSWGFTIYKEHLPNMGSQTDFAKHCLPKSPFGDRDCALVRWWLPPLRWRDGSRSPHEGEKGKLPASWIDLQLFALKQDLFA